MPRIALIILVSLLCFSCNPGADFHFPKDATIVKPTYSSLFEMGFTDHDTFMRFIDPEDSNIILGAYCWGKSAAGRNGFQKINQRSRMVVLSAVFVGMLEALHAQTQIVAIDDEDYISSPKTLKQVSAGLTSPVAKRGNIDKEAILKLKPDLLISYFIDQKGKDELEALKRAGIPVVYIQNYLETHPLGRAEWILVFGALSGKYSEALAIFSEIEEHYLSTRERIKDLAKPTVLVNAPFSGVWDVPAGNSYMARLIADAGGSYIYASSKGTGRIPLDVEKVTRVARHADFWINPGACRKKDCLLQMDKRLSQFDAYNDNQVYNCTKLLRPNGSNPWWDYGTVRPDLILLDLFTILHPEAEFSHEPVFFEMLP